ncbi:hypothetical protein MMC14_009484 [Varicellaria rhodocarpa]|nr:hypothetical protein [Varicellaria rhodocarpa]
METLVEKGLPILRIETKHSPPKAKNDSDKDAKGLRQKLLENTSSLAQLAHLAQPSTLPGPTLLAQPTILQPAISQPVTLPSISHLARLSSSSTPTRLRTHHLTSEGQYVRVRRTFNTAIANSSCSLLEAMPAMPSIMASTKPIMLHVFELMAAGAHHAYNAAKVVNTKAAFVKTVFSNLHSFAKVVGDILAFLRDREVLRNYGPLLARLLALNNHLVTAFKFAVALSEAVVGITDNIIAFVDTVRAIREWWGQGGEWVRGQWIQWGLPVLFMLGQATQEMWKGQRRIEEVQWSWQLILINLVSTNLIELVDPCARVVPPRKSNAWLILHP